MTITLADRRHLPEAPDKPERLTFKTADDESPSGQMIALDEREGIVTAIVSVTGVEDEVADIIEPGAYRDTLAKRRPKVCWAHSWERPIGKVLYIEELPPGDERLPVKTRDGRPWPAEAGALVATMQFNMKSQAGRDAFEAVVFYSESGECEYSIGYQVPPGKATRDKAGVRHIKALELYELSVVLFGAHTMTGTLSIKDAVTAARQRKALSGSMTTNPPGMVGTLGQAAYASEGIDYEALAAWQRKALGKSRGTDAKAALGDAADPDGPPDFSNGVMVAVYPDPAAADAVATHIAGPDDTLEREDLHVTLAYLGTTGEVSAESDDVVEMVTAAIEGMPVLTGEIGGIGQFPDTGEGAPTWAPVDVPGLGLLREAIVEALGEAVVSDHGFTPHMTLGYDIGLIDPVPPTPVTFSAVRVVFGNQTHDIALGSKVFTDGMKDGNMTTTKAFPTPTSDIEMDDFLLSLTEEDWETISSQPDTEIDGDGDGEGEGGDSDGGEGGAPAGGEGKARTPGGREGDDSPVGTPGGRQNWVDQTGGLPRYIRMVAHALMRRGMEKGRAIATAVATMKRWAAGAGDVTAKVQAAAAAALAEWEANRAEAHAKSAVYDPTLDRPLGHKRTRRPATKNGGTPASADTKAFPFLAGSYEERLSLIRDAVAEALRGDLVDEAENRYEWNYVDVRATWDDRLIASRHKWGPVEETEHYEMTYWLTDDGVDLGEPQRITLQVIAMVEDQETEDFSIADALDLADDVLRVAWALKTSKPTTIEGKAGRVLSGRNERALREAVERLIDVLAAAGVQIAATDEDRRMAELDPTDDADARREMDPGVDLESTAPDAQIGGKDAKPDKDGNIVLTADQIAADLTRLGLVTTT